MYTNLIYYLLVLLIFNAYQPPRVVKGDAWTAVSWLLLGVLVLVMAGRIYFRKLEKDIRLGTGRGDLHRQYHQIIGQLAVMAIIIFTLDVYLVHAPHYLTRMALFRQFEILPGLVALAVFTFYLAIIWSSAYPSYRVLYHSKQTRGRFVWSNITFILPMIFPWFLISLIFDLVKLLVPAQARMAIANPLGQLGFFFVFLVCLAVFLPYLIKTWWGCQPLPAGPVRTAIEDFCAKIGFTYADLLRWPIFEGNIITAGVMGLIKRFRYVLITDSLISSLDVEEIKAVVAHEAGHIKKHHLLFYLFFFMGYMILVYAVLDLIAHCLLSLDFIFDLLNSVDEQFQRTVFSLVYTLPMIVLLVLYFRYLFGFFMRNFERQADLYALEILPQPIRVATALEKIAFYSGNIRDLPSWHHFSVRERVEYIIKCLNNPDWITRHNQKVRLATRLYTGGVLLVLILGYILNFTNVGASLKSQTMVKAAQRAVSLNPADADLRLAVAGLYLERGMIGPAVKEYHQVMGLSPGNAEAMNNLAWIYATTKERAHYRPKLALELARRAVKLKPAAYIYDTLAEALLATGQFQEALDAARQAVHLGGDERSFYVTRLQRFDAAARERHYPGPPD
ncbi:MAG: M48 family metalloprotease [Deltaproteobacteria bacterium]|nr:M48 family metalloprotease [Deltaproteobacteria bacterium]